MDKGEYVIYGKNMCGEWKRFSKHEISGAKKSNVKKTDAVVLMYERMRTYTKE
jgi:hypothetical protein